MTRLLACQVFASKGVLAIENAFAPEFIASLRRAFVAEYAQHLVDRETDETSKVGDKRILVPVEIAGAFNTPLLYANPFVFPLIQDTLGEKYILGSFGAVTALPRADDQPIHRDHPFLFQQQAIDTLMPAYAVNVFVPLVDVNEYHGTTRVWPGSHLIWADDDEVRQLPSEDLVAQVGSCMLYDYRLVHQGTANRSEQMRSILYLTYDRPWFRDYGNPFHNNCLSAPVTRAHR